MAPKCITIEFLAQQTSSSSTITLQNGWWWWWWWIDAQRFNWLPLLLLFTSTQHTQTTTTMDLSSSDESSSSSNLIQHWAFCTQIKWRSSSSVSQSIWWLFDHFIDNYPFPSTPTIPLLLMLYSLVNYLPAKLERERERGGTKKGGGGGLIIVYECGIGPKMGWRMEQQSDPNQFKSWRVCWYIKLARLIESIITSFALIAYTDQIEREKFSFSSFDFFFAISPSPSLSESNSEILVHFFRI